MQQKTLQNAVLIQYCICKSILHQCLHTTVKLGVKERFDNEQIGVKEPFPATNCQFTS